MSQIHLRNRLRQTVLLAISSALLLSLTGCSSLAARKNALRRRDSAPYIGVRHAFRNLDECAHPTFIKPLPLFLGCLFPIYVASGLIVVADLPFSLALDTILYPTDKLYGAGRIYGILRETIACSSRSTTISIPTRLLAAWSPRKLPSSRRGVFQAVQSDFFL
jgi:uncharacterized protein YceK